MFQWLKQKKIKEKINNKNFFNQPTTSLSKSLHSNLDFIGQSIGHSPDVVIRSFHLGNSKTEVAIVYIDGLANENIIHEEIMKPIMLQFPNIEGTKDETSINSKIKDTIITISKTEITNTLEDTVLPILSGNTAFFIDGNNEALILSTPGWEKRSIEEPSTETSVRGPRDGFTETLRDNIAHIRRRIRDPNFTMIQYKVGRRSRADLAVIYIKGLTNQELLEEVKNRVEKIDMDMILGSGYVEQLIENDFFSPFPQTIATERPDKIASALMEGFVAIILDTTPFALIAPATFPMFMEVPEDYYEHWMYASLIRILRYLTLFISLFLPALYIALISFHQGLIPTKLLFSIAATREGVPFPSVIEALIMEITLEILREAGLRLPRPIGQAVGIVGGLVIGEAAVQAGIVSPIMVIVVALTAISSFALPMYAIGTAIRMLRFFLMFLAGTLGLYGIMLGYILITVHLIKLKSFGLWYTAPFVPYHVKDWKDFIIRGPMMMMKNRPEMMNTQDQKRKSSPGKR